MTIHRVRLPRFGVLAAACVTLVAAAGCQMKPMSTQPSAAPDGPGSETISVEELLGSPVAAAATQPAGAGPMDGEATLAYMEARRALVGREFEEAVEHLNRALELSANHLPARRLLTETYLEQGQHTLAREQAEILLQLDPRDVLGHFVIGSMLLRDNEFLPAARHLYQAVVWAQASGEARSTNALMARFLLGQALASRNYPRAAVEIYEPLLVYLEDFDSSPPEDPRLRQLHLLYRPSLHLLVAEFLCRLDQPDEAREFYEKALRFPAVRSRAQIGLVRCEQQAGRIDEARRRLDELATEQVIDENIVGLYRELYPDGGWSDHLMKVYQATPENLHVGLSLARQMIEGGMWTQAAGLLEKLIAVDPSDSTVLRLAVRCYRELNQLDRCAELLVAALAAGGYGGTGPGALTEWLAPSEIEPLAEAVDRLTVDPDREYARTYLRGIVAQVQGRRLKAAELYRRSWSLAPRFVPGYLAHGQMLLLDRRWREAAELIDRALEANEATAGLLYIRGVALAELDRMAEAQEALEQAVELSPRSDQIALALAELYIKRGQATPAVAIFKNALEGKFLGRDSLAELVQIMLQSNDLDTAEQILDQYRQRFGDDGYCQLLRAKLEYRRNEDAQAYRTALGELIGKTGRPGLARIELADLTYQNGDYREAIRIADELTGPSTALMPRDYQRILWTKALAQRRLMEYAESERTWMQLLSDWPSRTAFRTALAGIYLETLDFDRAIAILMEQLAQEEDDQQRLGVQEQIVTAKLGQNDLDGAAALIRGWMDGSEAGTRQALRRLLAAAYLTENRYPEAIEQFEALLADDPGNQRQWRTGLIAALVRSGRLAEALARIDGWLDQSTDPQERELITGLKLPVYVTAEEFDKAANLARARWNSSGGLERFARALSLVYVLQEAERFEEAELFILEHLSEYPEESPHRMDFQFRLVRVLLLAGQFDRAERFVLDQLKATEAQREWQQMLVRVYFASRETDKAIELLEGIIAAEPDTPWANNSLGYTLVDAGRDLDRGEELIRQALAGEPGSYAYLDSLAWALYRKGDLEQAEQAARMALAKMKQPMTVLLGYIGGADSLRHLDADPVIVEHLADILAARGKTEEALHFWRQALETAADYDEIDLEPQFIERVREKLEYTRPPITTTLPATIPATAPTTTSAPTTQTAQ